jgi:hypothetical protein
MSTPGSSSGAAAVLEAEGAPLASGGAGATAGISMRAGSGALVPCGADAHARRSEPAHTKAARRIVSVLYHSSRHDH